MKIAVLYNTPSDRFENDTLHREAEEDTVESALAVHKELKKNNKNTFLVPVTEHDMDEIIPKIKADLIFNIIEWTGVDTPFAMRAFDLMKKRGIPWTGATKKNYKDTCDKRLTKRMCKRHGFPTATWQEFVTGNEPLKRDLTYPLIVKVSNEHSSVGIEQDSVVKNARELRRVVRSRIKEFDQPVLAETFLTGREFKITILDRPAGLSVLPPVELQYTKTKANPLLTYPGRWDEKHPDYGLSWIDVAELEEPLEKKLEKLVADVFTTLGFRDYARYDIRCDADENPYILELNSNPGLCDDDESEITIAYKAAGMSFADFVWEIAQSAARRVKKTT